VLLRLARAAEASRSFEALSEEFGRATAAWYSERTLVRTEEPTLWLENEKPCLLASSSDTNAFASLPAKDTNDAPAKVEASSPGSESLSASLGTNLPPAWENLRRVEPGKYADADAVCLRRRLSYTFAGNPAVVTEQEEFTQVLTPEGKWYGEFDIHYSPPFEDINFLDCEVLSPAGKLVRLDPEAIRETHEPSVGDYQSGRRKFFSLPGVVPGAVLHVRFRTKWEKYPLPHVSMEIPLEHQVPVLDATVEVSVPKEAPFHFAFEQISAPDPSISQTSYGTTYSWRLENLPARTREILVSPHQQPRLLVSTFPDWADFADWYGRITKLTDEVTPELAAKAAELTRQARTDREKVLAVFNYVTALRYVAVPLGVNSYRPHAAANVFKNQFGDCKDKANLFNTLLHSLNIEANLVLVPRFSQAREDMPGLAFNHAISRITLDGQPMWVDTTDDVCRFGMLPPGDPGRRVLVIGGQRNDLVQLPTPQASEHRLKLRGELRCSGPGNPMPGTLSAVAVGYPDYQLRLAARQNKEYQASVPLLAARFRPVSGVFALEKQSATAVSALGEDFAWQAEGTWVGNSSTEDGKWLLHSPFWLPKEWEQALHHRKAPLYLHEGYPLTLDEVFDFALPPKAQPVALPGVTENQAEPLRWSIEWKKSGEDKLTARFQVELVRGDLSEADTPLFQKQLRELLAALAADAALSLPP
jgi:hypothetical protein